MSPPIPRPRTPAGLADLIRRTLTKVEQLTMDMGCCLRAKEIEPWDGLTMVGPFAAYHKTADEAVVLGIKLDGQQYRLTVELLEE